MKLNISNIILKVKAYYKKLTSDIRTISPKPLIIFLSVQTLVFLIAFFIFGLVPVQREVKSISMNFENKISSNSKNLSKTNTELINKILTSEHHEAFLKSNIQLSKTDSISLLIDLKDSIAVLTFKGVSLFESKITKISFNKGLRKLPMFLLDSLYSGPFQVAEEIASIEKFPIVIKKAPKDTLEANLVNAAPVLPKQSDVFYFFDFGNSFVLEIGQHEQELVGSKSSYRSYKRSKSRWLRKENINALINTEHRGYTYSLSIEIPREDARSIYRALPIKPFVVVRY